MATNRLVWGAVVLACAGVVGAAVSATSLTRANLVTAERMGDDTFGTALGNARAVYLQGYGVVLSAEMDVAPGFTPNPFRPAFSKEEIARIKEMKKQRLNTLRDRMQGLMVSYADSMQVPLNENIAVSVTVFYSKVEDTAGMPRQIVMAAPRSVLRSGNASIISASVKTQEFF